MLATTLEQVQAGKSLRVARLGKGPALVLLHGYPDNLQIWMELAPRLADCVEVIAFDWPGMGYSDSWPGGTTPFHMAERLKIILDYFELKQANIAGMDMGGQPALAFAAKYPDRIQNLIVMNSLVLWDETTSWEIQLLRKYGWNRTILNRLPRLVFNRAERTFLPRGVKLIPELRSDLWESFRQPAVRSFISRLCSGYQGTLQRLAAEYPRVTCPTLALWGERDKHFPLAHGDRLRAAIPGSTLQVISNGEHWMALHLADEVARSIRRFLSCEQAPE